MNKETKTAKEHLSKDTKSFWGWVCIEHKQTCERWLEFLNEAYGEDSFDIEEEFDTIIYNKIKDLKQTIKLYDEVEIK